MVYSKKRFHIPEGMTVTGNITADVPGEIGGIVNGDVFVKGTLIILKDGVINGNINAQELEVRGKVIGFIQCSSKIILRKTSFVKGNIRTVEIHTEKDAVVDGIIIKPGHEEYESAALNDPSIETMADAGLPSGKGFIKKNEDEQSQTWF